MKQNQVTTRAAVHNHRLCLLALLPRAEALAEVEALRRDFADRFGARHALRLPAHITLIPPFGLSDASLQFLPDRLAGFVRTLPRCGIHLQDFGFFHHARNRVIFVSVRPDPPLIRLQAALAGWMTREAGIAPPQRPYHPHLTLAHRDLDEPTFIRAWEYCSRRRFSRSFLATDVTWLDHNGTHWTPRTPYPLGPDRSG